MTLTTSHEYTNPGRRTIKTSFGKYLSIFKYNFLFSMKWPTVITHHVVIPLSLVPFFPSLSCSDGIVSPALHLHRPKFQGKSQDDYEDFKAGRKSQIIELFYHISYHKFIVTVFHISQNLCQNDIQTSFPVAITLALKLKSNITSRISCQRKPLLLVWFLINDKFFHTNI